MRYLLIALLVTGCASKPVPVTQSFPEAPAELLLPAEPLAAIPPDTRELSVLIDNANDNYSRYRELRIRYEAWQQWYREQRDNWTR